MAGVGVAQYECAHLLHSEDVMLRGRKPKPLPQPAMAVIVKTTRDASKDTRMPLAEAKEHYEAGRMVQLLNVGGDGPHYQWKADSDSRSL